MVPSDGLAAGWAAGRRARVCFCTCVLGLGMVRDRGRRLNRQMLGFSMTCKALNLPPEPAHVGYSAVAGRKTNGERNGVECGASCGFCEGFPCPAPDTGSDHSVMENWAPLQVVWAWVTSKMLRQQEWI